MFSSIQNMIAIDSTILLCGVAWIVAVFVLLNFFIRNFQRDPRLVKFAETLPGPRGIPFLGNYMDFYYGEDSLKTMINFLHKYGHVYRLWFGKHLVVGLSNVEDLEFVFLNSKMLAKPRIFHPYHDMWGDGLFTAPVDVWKKNRKKFYPAFANDRFDIYTAQINDVTRHAMNKMKNLIDEKEFSAWDFFVYLSFNVITKTMLNVEADSWNHESITQFHRNLSKVQQISFKRMCVPWFQIKFIDDLFHRKQLNDIIETIFKFSRKVLNEQKNEMHNASHRQEEKHRSIAAESCKSFSEILRELLNEGYDDKIVCDEIYTVISGGTNTNASVISFFLIAVAIHQDIQHKLYDEIYEIFGDSDRDANQEDITRLPFLDQVLKESLRRFTISPFVLREIQDDSKIGNRVFPAGTAILISIGAVHFNPEIYPNPMDFNPDHFSPEAVKKRHKLTYLPFSAAARNCIGRNFAMLEFKLILSSLLRNFSFHTTMTMEDIKLNMGSVIHSTNNLNLSIKPRIKK